METLPTSSPEAAPVAAAPVHPTARRDPDPLGRCRHWCRRLLAGNPFYLISAALLLYAIYGISGNGTALGGETAQLRFNFGALQGYELLLVVTAVILGRHAIRYDASLLACLETLFLLAPFILVSQGLFVNSATALTLCALAGVLALLRLGGLKGLLPELRLPPRFLTVAGAFAAANAALPLWFRFLHDTPHALVEIESLDAGYRLCWIALLPALASLPNWMPRPAAASQRTAWLPWLPLISPVIWTVATGVHVFAIGWVYKIDWHPAYVMPTLWVAGWTAWNLAPGFQADPGGKVARWFLAAPLIATLTGLHAPLGGTFTILAGFNVVAYALIAALARDNRIPVQLWLASLAVFLTGAPSDWPSAIGPSIAVDHPFAAATVAYIVLRAAGSRNPRWGMVGALAVSLITGSCVQSAGSLNLAVQAGLVFLVCHSLRWSDTSELGVRLLRRLVAAIWVVHAAFWMWLVRGEPGSALMLCGFAGAVLGCCGVIRLLRGSWPPIAVPVSGVLVLLSIPSAPSFSLVQRANPGLLLVAVSFALFALGTWLAFRRQHWLAQLGGEDAAR